MVQEYWQRQSEQPLFQEAEWVKPERKSQAGKLLIIGGNGNEFQKTQASYQQAIASGIGECKVVLPKTAQTLIGVTHPDIEYLEVTKKGNISLQAKSDLLGFASWADNLLLPGELGKNHETTQLLEDFIGTVTNKLIVTRDAVDILKPSAKKLLNKIDLTLVLSIAQLQDLLKTVAFPQPIRFQASINETIEVLHELTEAFPVSLIMYFQTNLLTAFAGQVSSTKLSTPSDAWRRQTATNLALWQNWTNQQNALTQAAWEFKSSLEDN